MNYKKVLNFLILKPVFTRGNFSTVLLVCGFMAIYVMMGGKITPPPSIEKARNFGVDNLDNSQKSDLEILGIKESNDRAARQDSLSKQGFRSQLEQNDKNDPIKKELFNGKIEVNENKESEIKMIEQRHASDDRLNQIEERLKKDQ